MNTKEFETNLKKYADVAIRVGLNLQPGQRLVIWSLLENALWVHSLTESAYENGAKHVTVLWEDEQITRIAYKKANINTMDEIENFRWDALVDFMNNGDAVLVIYNPDPDLSEGIDSKKVGRYQKSWSTAMKPFRDLRSTEASNCAIVSAPTPAWAAKVLPEVPLEDRVEKLWELIFEICRVNADDPVAAWKTHVKILTKRSKLLNKQAHTALKLTGPGTDLTVGLPKGHLWRGGGDTTQNDIYMVPNVPTEEVFTLPHRLRIDGVVRATKPLNFLGLSDKFSLTFQKGKIVDVSAEEGEQHLKNIIATDDGSSYIGEIALVPNSSPISQSGRIFYSILYDENASSHMAIGSAYRFSLKGGGEMNEEEFSAAGGNVSAVHADFMVGSGELDVDGLTEDGKAEPVMRAGEWVIDL